jgi:hypothetical protein
MSQVVLKADFLLQYFPHRSILKFGQEDISVSATGSRGKINLVLPFCIVGESRQYTPEAAMGGISARG